MEVKTPEKEVEHDIAFDEEGNVVLKKKSKVKTGKKSKAAGGQFELRVRKDLEEKGWIVDKWSNNIDLETKKIIPAKKKFNSYAKIMTIGTGFPDFIAFQKMNDSYYKVIGVEVKMNGTLSKIEKEKCKLYLENNTFTELLIAKKIKEKNRVRVEYTDAKKVLERMR
ncbi:hypothetical protein HN604_00240 [archaeon]|jgi:hypothetical protein|nr:hypothetical protein [archaeon]MBT7251711.1 hypothetical protein [archaeon]MBT7660494.1 hypothetical protein [archaeon]